MLRALCIACARRFGIARSSCAPNRSSSAARRSEIGVATAQSERLEMGPVAMLSFM